MARSRDLSTLINTVSADGVSGKFSVDPTTGQIEAVVNSTVGTDYQSTLYDGFLARAWVNFNGTGTVAIRASGNVSSITDNGGTGDYTVNFTLSLPDSNYTVTLTNQDVATGTQILRIRGTTSTSGTTLYNTSGFRIACGYDTLIACATVFR